MGRDPAYADAARRLAAAAVERGLRVVYGGGSVGLMGVLADAVLAAGGEITGVIPRTLWEREVGHRGLNALRIVDTMHERKALMAELADGFVALPGGIGTLDEFFEIWTWAQLGVHRKPCGLLNVRRYFDPLLAFLRHTVEQEFLRRDYHEMMLTSADVDELLATMTAYAAPTVPKWLDRGAL